MSFARPRKEARAIAALSFVSFTLAAMSSAHAQFIEEAPARAPSPPPRSAPLPTAPVPTARPTPPKVVPATPARPRLSLAPAVDDDDDPKPLSRRSDHLVVERAPEHPAPFVKLGYRHFSMNNLDHTPLSLNAFELDLYAVSRRWLRVATELEAGAATGTLSGSPSNNWFVLTGATVGFQYPWRVTPFVDARFAAGLLGGGVAGSTALTTMYVGGLDVGVELYLVDRAFVSASIGWVHPVYRGIDYAFSMTNPKSDPIYLDFAADSFTFKFAVGF